MLAQERAEALISAPEASLEDEAAAAGRRQRGVSRDAGKGGAVSHRRRSWGWAEFGLTGRGFRLGIEVAEAPDEGGVVAEVGFGDFPGEEIAFREVQMEVVDENDRRFAGGDQLESEAEGFEALWAVNEHGVVLLQFFR